MEHGLTVDGLITIAQDQITNIKLYIIHHLKVEYILPFLYAKSGDNQKAIELFDSLAPHHFNKDEMIKNKVREIPIALTPER